MTSGGVHLLHGVSPDIAVFAKAMANGYAMAAVIGTETIMQAAQSTFISSTNWTERIGPAAALATIRKYRERDVAAHLAEIGARVIEGWREAAAAVDLPIHINGFPSMSHFAIDHPDELALSTLFTERMLSRGYLANNQFRPSFAHQRHHVEAYLAAVREVFSELADAARTGDAASRLSGPPARRGFYRLT